MTHYHSSISTMNIIGAAPSTLPTSFKWGKHLSQKSNLFPNFTNTHTRTHHHQTGTVQMSVSIVRGKYKKNCNHKVIHRDTTSFDCKTTEKLDRFGCRCYYIDNAVVVVTVVPTYTKGNDKEIDFRVLLKRTKAARMRSREACVCVCGCTRQIVN